jgi:hypothetical protein
MDQIHLMRKIAQRRLPHLALGEDEAEPDREGDADEHDDADRPEKPRTEPATAHRYAGMSL